MRRLAKTAFLGAALPALALTATSARAQHEGHTMDMSVQADEPQEDPSSPGAMSGMDHATMDHGAMDHSAMDHAAMGHAVPPEGPPPTSAGTGPARAADAVWGADAMAASRAELVRMNGAMTVTYFQADRIEYRAHAGKDGYLWDLQGYYGGDTDKLWLKSEGEGSFGNAPESAEVQALYSRAIGPWFDLQAGVRQDLTGPDRTYGVIGVQGLMPYRFEVDAAAFVSNRGDVTARIEAELDQRVTQRLVLQPRGELSLAAQDVPELGIGAGLDRIEAGLRLRYQVAREFAPYIGIEREWRLGTSADLARAAGEKAAQTSFVIGLRAWL
ncbi:copper resistance protein B [Novosphingobium profundi]|uniref:copper resistance protein B n=1 Tax=Novosphingobium profundi TaxID=1774954 RepID=UPI001BD9F721|nr:copper resistance protein B [Novosphingobium profundi]MBT0669456.1 copper resistance protein B [Novosphingobium profundi]